MSRFSDQHQLDSGRGFAYVVSGRGISVNAGLFEYPSVLLWTIPAFSAVGAYFARNLQMRGAANFLAAFPLALLIAAEIYLHKFADYWN